MKGEFLRNVLTIIGGTGMAQAIPLLISPLLARFYGPIEFGYFALFMAVFNPLSVIVCGRLEIAVVLPKEESLARKVASVAFLFGVVLSLFIFLLLLVFGGYFSQLFNEPQLLWILPMVPFGLFAVAFFQPVNFWLQRVKAFKIIAINKFSQSISLSAVSLILGFFAIQSGLISGFVVGWVVLSFVAFLNARNTGFEIRIPGKAAIREVWEKYGDYPKYNAIPALLNQGALALPVFFIASRYTTEETGLFNMSRQLLFLPASFISVGISQVFYQKISALIKSDKKITNSILKLIVALILPAAVLIVMVSFWGPEVFSLTLGGRWTESGRIAQYMVFPTMLMLVTVPILIVLPALGKIRILSFWQSLFFGLIALLYFLPQITFLKFIKYLSILEAIGYLLYLITILYYSLKFDSELKSIKEVNSGLI